jgi:hypothetical protein
LSTPRGAYDHCQERDTVNDEVGDEKWRLRCRNSQIASSARPTRLTHSRRRYLNTTLLTSLVIPPRSLTHILPFRCSKLKVPGNKSAQPDPGGAQIFSSIMSSPENIKVMAKVAKEFLGPTVVGTFFNICLVSEHSIPHARTAYFDSGPIIALIVVSVWSPAHASADILSTFSQVCHSRSSMSLAIRVHVSLYQRSSMAEGCRRYIATPGNGEFGFSGVCR